MFPFKHEIDLHIKKNKIIFWEEPYIADRMYFIERVIHGVC